MRLLSMQLVHLFVAAVAILGMAVPAVSNDLYVRNSGLDSAHCGGAQSACRTINQAIVNAAAGDSIWVGPGRYGDLNGDGDLEDPGEEHLKHIGFDLCMICIRKPIHLYSLFGPDVTVITGPSYQNPIGIVFVDILSNGVTVDFVRRAGWVGTRG